jgi:hypothetical protein
MDKKKPARSAKGIHVPKTMLDAYRLGYVNHGLGLAGLKFSSPNRATCEDEMSLGFEFEEEFQTDARAALPKELCVRVRAHLEFLGISVVKE